MLCMALSGSEVPLRTAAAIGIALPDNIVANAEIAERLGVDDTWIETRTGIRERRHAAARRAADRPRQPRPAATRSTARRRSPPDEIDLVLVATTTADEVMPNAAPLVADALGAAPRRSAFDVGAACTGFVAALGLAAGMIEAGRARHVLVIGADLMSRVPRPRRPPDGRASSATAPARVLVGRAPAPAASAPVDPRRRRLRRGTSASRAARAGLIAMDGQETFRARRRSASPRPSPPAALRAGCTLDDIDLVRLPPGERAASCAAVGERLDLRRRARRRLHRAASATPPPRPSRSRSGRARATGSWSPGPASSARRVRRRLHLGRRRRGVDGRVSAT